MNSALAHVTTSGLETITLPVLPSPILNRPLHERRLIETNCRLRLLLAPPGYGKTVLMAACAHRATGRALWIALQGRSTSFDELIQLIGEQLQPNAATWNEAQLFKALQAYPAQLRIMLDDWPRDKDAAVDAGLGRLLSIQNAQLEWWVSSRRRPNCNFPRLILQGEYHEMGMEDLAFSKKEIAGFVGQYRAPVFEDVSRIFNCTQGWPAAVAFYCQPREGLKRDDTPPQLIRDYLRHEIIEALPHTLREIVISMARLECFSKPLCQHIWGTLGPHILDGLIDQGLPIVPVGDTANTWYRISPAAAAGLIDEHDPTDFRAMHRQACQFFISTGEIRLAIEQAIAANQPDIAASLLERLNEEELINTQQASHKLISYRKALPTELLECTPKLAILYALTFAITSQLDEAQNCLNALGKFLPASSHVEQQYLLALWQGISGIIEHCKGNPESAAENCRQALEALASTDSLAKFAFWPILIQQQLFCGNLNQADDLIQQATEAAQTRKESWPLSTISLYESLLLESRGQLIPALSLLNNQLAAQESLQSNRNPTYHRLLIRRAYVHMLMGEFDEAHKGFFEGARLCQENIDPFGLHGKLGLFKLALLDENTKEAEYQLNQAELWLKSNNVTTAIYRDDLYQCRALLMNALGDPNAAQVILQSMGDSISASNGYNLPFHTASFRYETNRTLAQVYSKQGMLSEALETLTNTLNCATKNGYMLSAIDTRCAIAELELARGEDELAAQHIQIAIRLCEAQGYKFPLLALKRRKSRLFNSTPENNLLSRREIEVLRLIETGYSNQEIADHLVLSVYTVKSHIQRMTSKLEVKRRTQAIAKAKALGLI